MAIFSADNDRPARRRRGRTVGWILLTVAVLGAIVVGLVPSSYVIEEPGPVYNTLGTTTVNHEIVPVLRSKGVSAKNETVDVVGPVCESGDFFARDRALPPVKPGDLVVLLDAGAYGMSQTSNYNTRPRPAEVLVQGKAAKLIRRRETMHDLFGPELVP